MEILINAGADVNGYDRHGNTPLSAATEKGHAQCVKLLIEAGADVNLKRVGHL